MKATLVERTATSAAIRLTPNWLGRLFGARDVLVDLEYAKGPPNEPSKVGWRMAGSRRWLSELHYTEREMLETALDRVPVAAPPRAVARELAPGPTAVPGPGTPRSK